LLGGPLICVIDDDVSVRKALVGLIVSMGYRCCGHDSAEAALESGEAEAAGCILTDIHMPGLDGFALKQVLDARGCGAGMIMMTARSEGHLERRALEAGALCFMRKPLRAEALAKCLARALTAG
jgi:FixJ family two-component response regulator